MRPRRFGKNSTGGEEHRPIKLQPTTAFLNCVEQICSMYNMTRTSDGDLEISDKYLTLRVPIEKINKSFRTQATAGNATRGMSQKPQKRLKSAKKNNRGKYVHAF